MKEQQEVFFRGIPLTLHVANGDDEWLATWEVEPEGPSRELFELFPLRTDNTQPGDWDDEGYEEPEKDQDYFSATASLKLIYAQMTLNQQRDVWAVVGASKGFEFFIYHMMMMMGPVLVGLFVILIMYYLTLLFNIAL